MPISLDQIDLIEDRVRTLGEVTLSAEIIIDIFHQARQGLRHQVALENIASAGRSNVDVAGWASRRLSDEKEERLRHKLRHPRRLVTLSR